MQPHALVPRLKELVSNSLAAHGAFIYRVISTLLGASNEHLSPISLSTLNLIPFTIEQLGKNPNAPIRRDYELRSRGPAVLGAEVLDKNIFQASFFF